jgi:hypothetical protein
MNKGGHVNTLEKFHIYTETRNSNQIIDETRSQAIYCLLQLYPVTPMCDVNPYHPVYCDAIPRQYVVARHMGNTMGSE